MIMKLNVSNELKSRLMHAAENGSVIAKDILSEVKKNVPVEEVIRGSYNFFSTKRKRTEAGTFKKIRIVFTACNKDLGHPNFPDRNNPQAPWFPENRTDLEPSTFIELFKNLGPYQPDEINYFCSAISLDSKVTIRLHDSMNDFMEAYLESNYSPISDGSESSLHNSCIGTLSSKDSTITFYKDDKKLCAAEFRALAPGESTTIRLNAGNLDAGEYVISAVVDEDNKVIEKREDNNSLAMSGKITVKEVESVDIVPIASWSPSNPGIGDEVDFTVTVSNKGNQNTADSSRTVTVKIKDEDGNYRITGRIKDMIIRGGENIYPREIEEFLYKLDGVKDVQVAGIPSKKYGEAVGAFIILQEGVEMHESDVRDFCKNKISRYKIPKYVFFVKEFPMTGSGKIQKFRLKDLGLQLCKEQGIEII